MEVENRSIVQSEELWEGYPAGPQPFATLAISQPLAWDDLIMLHLQLANVLVMMAHFNLKVTKPVKTLFDSIVSLFYSLFVVTNFHSTRIFFCPTVLFILISIIF